MMAGVSSKSLTPFACWIVSAVIAFKLYEWEMAKFLKVSKKLDLTQEQHKRVFDRYKAKWTRARPS
jgi:hypothetical protein